MSKSEEIIKSVSFTWHAEDVQERAAELGYDLTPEECSDILKNMERYHDASVGMNWDVIDYHITELKEPYVYGE